MKVIVCGLSQSKTNSYEEENLRALAQYLAEAFRERAEGVAPVHADLILLDQERGLDDWAIAAIESADGAVIECSEEDLRLAFIAGQARGRQLPVLLLRSARARELAATPFLDVEEPKISIYSSAEEMVSDAQVQNALGHFMEELAARWQSGRYHAARLVSEVWFGESGGDVHVICPPSYDNLESAFSTSRNYIHLDKFGDKDAFLEIAVFLSRVYGYRSIPHTPEEFPARQLLRDHLIVVGGPGLEEAGDGNSIAREIMARTHLGLSYGSDPPGLQVAGKTGSNCYQCEFDRRDRLVADYGVFARIKSPFNPERTVILIQGVHTAGVLGASQAFTDTSGAAANLEVLESKFGGGGGDWSFVVPMRVELVGNEVLVPRIEGEKVLAIE